MCHSVTSETTEHKIQEDDLIEIDKLEALRYLPAQGKIHRKQGAKDRLY